MSHSSPASPSPTPTDASAMVKPNSLSRFSTRLKTIKANLRKISDNLQRKAAEPTTKVMPEDALRVIQLQQEIAELVVLLPRIEKLLIQFETNTFHRMLRWLRLSSKDLELTVLFEYIEMAIEILSHVEPSLLVAQKMRIDVERTVTRHEHPLLGIVLNRFRDIYRSDSDPLKVVFGLTLTTTLSAALFFGSLVGIARQDESKLDGDISRLEERLLEIREELARDNIQLVEEGGNIRFVRGERLGEPQNALADAIGNEIEDQPQQELMREFRQKRQRQENLEITRAQERQDNSILFLLVLVMSSGTLGSAISILIRINDFEKQEVSDPLIPIFTGAFKPIIGSSFGLLMYALFSSGIISVQIVPSNTARGTEFFFCSVAFVIGFSERLAKDVIKKTENLLGAEGSSAGRSPQHHPSSSQLPFYPLPITAVAQDDPE